MGTFDMLDAARRLDVPAFVHASSSATLTPSQRGVGEAPIPIRTVPADESHPLWTETSYGLSKILNEETLLGFARAHPSNCVALRLAYVYMLHGGAGAAAV